MFNRTNMQQVEQYFSQTGPNIVRLEGVAKGVLLVLQTLLASLSIPAQLWAAGVGAAVAATGEDGVPKGSQYTRRWWLALQAALAVLVVATKVPLSTLLSLAVVDGEGTVVKGADGQLIRPFAVYDPALVAPEFLAMTLELLVHSDPEMDAPIADAAGSDPEVDAPAAAMRATNVPATIAG